MKNENKKEWVKQAARKEMNERKREKERMRGRQTMKKEGRKKGPALLYQTSVRIVIFLFKNSYDYVKLICTAVRFRFYAFVLGKVVSPPKKYLPVLTCP